MCMYMYVYIIVNNINQKKYIGLSINKKKWHRDNYYGSGKLIKQAIKKYGKENFTKEIVKEFDNEEDCREYERFLIQEFNAVQDHMYYNLAPGGYGGGAFGRVVSEEQKQKYIALYSGKKRPKEIGDKISKALKGKNKRSYRK